MKRREARALEVHQGMCRMSSGEIVFIRWKCSAILFCVGIQIVPLVTGGYPLNDAGPVRLMYALVASAAGVLSLMLSFRVARESASVAAGVFVALAATVSAGLLLLLILALFVLPPVF